MPLLIAQQLQRPGLIRASACGRGGALNDLADSHDFATSHDGERIAAYADQHHQVFDS